MLAVAGGAWALFGRDEHTTDTDAIGPKVPTSAPTRPAFGPVAPGKTTAAAVTPTSTKPVAATAAATATSSPAPSKAPVTTAAPTAAPTTAPTKAPAVGPAAPKPVVKPPVTAPQQGGTVAKKDYTFKVARGDTLWDLTERILTDTGRPTLNATVVAHVAKFHQLNQQVIGSDPNLILPGQVLVWPVGL